MKLFFEAGTVGAPDSAEPHDDAYDAYDDREPTGVRSLASLRPPIDDEWAHATRAGTKPITMEWNEWALLHGGPTDVSVADDVATTPGLMPSWFDVALPSGF